MSKVATVISILSGYVITSFYFLKHPTLLHKKKHVNFVARHISHRGGAGEGYENTMGAFEKAIKSGTDMLEVDCHCTKDGEVVVVHDNNLLRLTGLNQDISSMRYDELPALKECILIDFEPECSYRSIDAINDDRCIPLLEDLFRTYKNIPINIDIKQNDDKLIKNISNLIIQYDRENYCVWGSISDSISKKCFKENPNIHLLFSRKRVILLLIYYYIGLLPFLPVKETYLEIFLPSVYEKWPNVKKKIPFSELLLQILDLLMIRKTLFLHLRERGIQVYLWVLNEDREFERAFKAGVTGIITDYPTRLSKFIQNNKQIIEPFPLT